MGKWDEYGERFLELRARGMSYRRISKQMDVSVTTLKKWGQEWDAKIQELGRERLAKFVEEQLLAMEQRLQLRAEQIMRMRDELSERDLSQLDDATLLRIYLRYVDAAGKEIQPVKVEISNPLAAYERVLVQCLQIPDDMKPEDIPRLAAEWARGPAPDQE